MIDEISVENLALIECASFMPSAGLTVLTGETGAGKTALVSAVKLLCGARANKDAVREGQQKLTVEGRIIAREENAGSKALVDAAQDGEDEAEGGGARAEENSAEEPDEYIVSRSVDAQGKSRAKINGHMATMKELAACVQSRIDLCGQHEHQELMDTSNHTKILDAWAGAPVQEALKDYAQKLRAAKDALAKLERIREAAGASSAKLDEAKFTLRTIDEVAPQPGEYEDIKDQLARAEHAETLASAAHGAYAALAGADAAGSAGAGTFGGGAAGVTGFVGSGAGSSDFGGSNEYGNATAAGTGAIDLLCSAADALEGAANYDETLNTYAQTIREATYVLEDVERDVRTYRDSIDFSAGAFEQLQQRMSALTGLIRQFGQNMEGVFEARQAAAQLISAVDNSAELAAEAQEKLDAAEKDLAKSAVALTAAREKAAPKFAKLVSEQMARLHMGTAKLECKITRLPRDAWTAAGSATAEFCFTPGVGLSARPLARIASGGELSRVLLAIKVVMGKTDYVDTLIFDEVDAGCGGETALALAEVLAHLAQTHQVIVITHLAQVAVRADTHYLVSKTEGAAPKTTLAQIEGNHRTQEIARMLSGSVTNASLMHAKEMLEAYSGV